MVSYFDRGLNSGRSYGMQVTGKRFRLPAQAAHLARNLSSTLLLGPTVRLSNLNQEEEKKTFPHKHN